MGVLEKINKHLNEAAKRHLIRDDKGNRIGLIHHIYKGDGSIDIDNDVSDEHKKLIHDEFEKLEEEVYNLIDNNANKFELFLKKNNFHSGMGSIGYK